MSLRAVLEQVSKIIVEIDRERERRMGEREGVTQSCAGTGEEDHC